LPSGSKATNGAVWRLNLGQCRQCLWNRYVCRPFWSWKPLLIHYVCPCCNVHFCRYQI